MFALILSLNRPHLYLRDLSVKKYMQQFVRMLSSCLPYVSSWDTQTPPGVTCRLL